MKLINYSEENVKVSNEIRLKAEMLENSVKDKLVEKYCNGDLNDYNTYAMPVLIRQFPYILWALDGELEGKRILDLGCGTVNCKDIQGLDYEPWLCRLLLELGVDVIGVDVNDNLRNEEFSHKVMDLFNEDLLISEVDLVHAASLFDSPTLSLKYGVSSGEKLKERLIPKFEKIDGVFLIS